MEDVTKKHEILTKAVEQTKRESGAKKVLKSTKYIKDAEEEAKREGETYAYLILNEMLPLLKSYFLGRFYCDFFPNCFGGGNRYVIDRTYDRERNV